MDKRLKSRFKSNLVFAFVAQGTSFLFSVFMSLIVPKMLGIEQFAYWQLFIFYSTYVGFFHFGLSDGIYLKYGGIEESNLERRNVGSQFWMMIMWQIIVCLIVLPVILKIIVSPERKIIWIFIAIYLVVANATWYLGFVFQAINQTKVYSIATIISKIFFIVFLIILVNSNCKRFEPFMVLYVLAQLLALTYTVLKGKQIVFIRLLPFKQVFGEVASNIKIGINLTISNIVGSLILGVGRQVVDMSAGIKSFGVLSLAISISNFFLQFISQVSMVLFPALRQVEEKKMKIFFLQLREFVSFILCLVLLLYMPLSELLVRWLPQYKESFYYMIFLLPICIFDGKMQLVYNTYMKVLRKEKVMLRINIIALILSVILCSIGAFFIQNIIAVAVSMTIVIMFRCLIANIYLSKQIGVSIDKNYVWEVILCISFVIFNLCFSTLQAFLLFTIMYIVYVGIYFDKIKNIKKVIFNKM